MYEYKPVGICPTKIRFNIYNNKIHDVSFEKGCDGNLKALSILVDGMDPEELIKRLKGVQCSNRSTSCADQLTRAVESVKGGTAD